MKINKIVFTLTLALTTVLATTGCKHGPTKVTPMFGERPPVVENDNNPGTIPGGMLPPPDNSIGMNNVTPGSLATSTDWDPANMNQDRSALAAYTVHFQFDSAVIEDKEQSNIASVAQALAADPSAKLLIEGNCDERGTEEYNRSLGERRALAVREALAKDGVDPMRVRTISYGKDKPIDPGHDDAAWTKNRRADFVLLHPKMGI